MDNSINNINFKGTFMIKTGKMPSALKEGLEKKISNYKKIIYKNVDTKGTDLFVLNDKFDYDFTKFIKLNSIGFKYFPDINTSLVSNAHDQSEIIKMLESSKLTKISRMTKLIEFIEKHRFANRSIKDTYTEKADAILKALKITTDVKPQKIRGGVIKIADTDNGKFVNISPKDKYGITYVYTNIRGENSSRYALNDECEVLCVYNSLDGISKFKERFNNAIKDNIEKL